MKRRALLFLLVTIPCFVHAQASKVLDVHVSIATPVVGLTFNATSHQQEATFSVSASATPPAGCTLQYGWTEASGAVVFDDPHAASTTACASGSGIYYPRCGVVAVNAQGARVKAGDDSRECAAIGGPITISVSGNAKPTYNHDKNDKTKSWYLTYYGSGSEVTHNATMKIDGQPTITRQGVLKGTTITWTLPGSTATADSKTTQFDQNGSISAQPLSVLVKATGDFQDGTPKVKFHFDDGVISGDADDDSAQFQISQGTAPNITWRPLVYKVSGHVPMTLTRSIPATPDQNVPQPQGKTYWTNLAQIKYILKDTNGDVMPGVYVQERFTDNRLSLTTNNETGFVWITLLSSTLDSGTVAASDGTFQNYDNLQYTWPGTTANVETTTHSYYGGTTDASSLATTGIPLGAATITFTPGQPGNATQTDPPPPTP